nr:unnamed protein product [Callosobruchus analis]
MMSSQVCSCCSKRVESHLLLLCCVCKKSFFHGCVSLTATETRLINSKKSVSWACNKCEEMGSSLNDLKAAIFSLQSQIKAITSSTANSNVSDMQFEDIVQEVFERENRKCNLVIFGMKEQDSAVKNIRSESENAEVAKVLSYLSQSVTVSSVR